MTADQLTPIAIPEGWERGQALPGEEFILHGFAGTAQFTQSWHPKRTNEKVAEASDRADRTFGQ